MSDTEKKTERGNRNLKLGLAIILVGSVMLVVASYIELWVSILWRGLAIVLMIVGFLILFPVFVDIWNVDIEAVSNPRKDRKLDA